MITAQRWILILGLGLIAKGNGSTAPGYQAVPADASLVVTIHVHNFAEIDRKTLTQAETVASKILRKAGVESRWIASSNGQYPNSVDDTLLDLTHISLYIEPHAVSSRLSNEVMGLAPGSGPDRNFVYVFFNRTRGFNAPTGMSGLDRFRLSTSRTLGYVVLHEIGHVLLNMEGHSERGIMRGKWSHQDLQDIAWERLFFTPQQAEVMRAEIARRRGLRIS